MQLVAIDRVTAPGNVRELETEHVDNLAASIQLRGLRVALIVRPDGDQTSLLVCIAVPPKRQPGQTAASS